jgi:hypothetical protein
MTDFPSFPDDGSRRIVYVREVRTADLPDEVRARTGGLEHLYAIHASNGEVLALVTDRDQAFIVARQNEMSPVSVH